MNKGGRSQSVQKAAELSDVPRVPTVVPEPMLARLTDRLPIGPTWSYEVKWDGYRCLALKAGDAVTLRSRSASNLTAAYPAVAAALRTLTAHRALLDGEIVALDREGRPSFQALQHSQAPRLKRRPYAGL